MVQPQSHVSTTPLGVLALRMYKLRRGKEKLECLPSMCKALGLIPYPEKTSTKEQKLVCSWGKVWLKYRKKWKLVVI
jgi:hypothetical protein